MNTYLCQTLTSSGKLAPQSSHDEPGEANELASSASSSEVFFVQSFFLLSQPMALGGLPTGLPMSVTFDLVVSKTDDVPGEVW